MASTSLLDEADLAIVNQSSHDGPPVGRAPESPAIRAIARHRALIVACAAVFAVIGAGLGVARPVSYTASTTLQVGKVNPNSPGFYGFVQSATDLATAFSRSIVAEPVLDSIHHQLGLRPVQTVERLSAEPIPNSPTFRVIATGPTAGAAIGLANVASDAVVTYVGQSNTADPDRGALLSSYRAASLRLAKATSAAGAAAAQFKAHPGATTRVALDNAQAQLAAERLELQAIAANYRASAQSITTTGLVSLLAGATTASNDRTAKIELYAFTGLLAGLAIGCAAAFMLERRRGRRATIG
jgi:hypothetical protein